VAEKDIDTLKGSMQEPSIRFLYAFFIALLLPLLANLIAGQDITSSGYLEISYGYFVFYSIMVFLSYLCVYLAIIKEIQIFKYPLFMLFFLSLLAKYQFFNYALSIVNYSINGLPDILNLFASLLAIISAFLLIYCVYVLFAYNIYFWNRPENDNKST
jgi:hypothetical protein